MTMVEVRSPENNGGSRILYLPKTMVEVKIQYFLKTMVEARSYTSSKQWWKQDPIPPHDNGGSKILYLLKTMVEARSYTSS